MSEQKTSAAGKANGQPSWGSLIGLGAAAIIVVNLLGITVVLEFRPSPTPLWIIGLMWAIALIILAVLGSALRGPAPRARNQP